MIFFIRKKPFHSFVAMSLSGILDAIDGKVSRYLKETSKFGGFLDFVFEKLTSNSIVKIDYWMHPLLKQETRFAILSKTDLQTKDVKSQIWILAI